MELREIFAPIIKWWWLVAASVAVAMVFSLVAVLYQDPVYSTSTTLMIGRVIENPNPDYSEVYLSESLATTYADIAKREPVRQGTMDALSLTWLPQYVVRPVPNTQLLEISVSDSDPVRAQAVANELARQLILQTPTNRQGEEQRQEFINQQLDDLEARITQTQDEIDARQNELANLIGARQIADVQNQIGALQSKLAALQSNYTSLLANTQQGASNRLSVIEEAIVPGSPVGPNVLLIVLTAAVFGAAIAVGSAYLLEYLDNSLKSPDEIKRVSNLPVLTGIPLMSGGDYPEKLVAHLTPRSPVAEAYRTLRTGIQFSTIDRPGSMAILVGSPNPTEGKSVTAANLAVVLAQAENKVLLVDADLRRPVAHRIFGLDNRTGLTELLRKARLDGDEQEFDDLLNSTVRPTEIDNLSLLASGPIPPNPSELLGSHKNGQLISLLKQRYDYIVFDSPPVLVVTDAVVLSTLVDGVVLVVDADRTQKTQFKQCTDRLREVNANILGVVVNRLSQQRGDYYYYYSHYYYQSKEQPRPALEKPA